MMTPHTNNDILSDAQQHSQDLKVAYLLLGAIVLLGALVRSHCLNELTLWYDEAFSWKMTTFPLSEQWSRAAGDNHPPLYFILLKLWTLIWGHSPQAVRSMSACFGILTIVGVFFCVREISNLAVRHDPQNSAENFSALGAAALLAFSPFQIEWSQTTRMYSMATCLAIWSTWGLVRSIHSPSTRWLAWAMYSFLAAGLIYTHYYGLFVLMAHIIYFAGCLIRDRFAPIPQKVNLTSTFIQSVSAFGLIGILWLPWFNNFLVQRARCVSDGWTRPFSAEHFVTSVYQLFDLEWKSSVPAFSSAILVTALVIFLSLFLILFGRHAERLIGLVVITTFAVALLFSSTGKLSVIGARYFVISHVFVLCSIMICLHRLPFRSVRAIVSMLLLGFASWQCYAHIDFRDERSTYPGYRALARHVEIVRTHDEIIVVANPNILITVNPYLTNRDRVFVLGERADFPFNVGISTLTDDEYVTSQFVSELRSKHIWVIDSVNQETKMPIEWVDVLEKRFMDWTWGELTLRQYERRDELRKSIMRPAGA